MKFTVKAHGKTIVGRICDVKESSEGIKIVDTNLKNITILVLVDVVGPRVKRCKVGDIICARAIDHMWLRDGTRVALVQEEDVRVTLLGCIPPSDPKSLLNVVGLDTRPDPPLKPTAPPPAQIAKPS
jgi:hypothetical protein